MSTYMTFDIMKKKISSYMYAYEVGIFVITKCVNYLYSSIPEDDAKVVHKCLRSAAGIFKYIDVSIMYVCLTYF